MSQVPATDLESSKPELSQDKCSPCSSKSSHTVLNARTDPSPAVLKTGVRH